jgi:hypothetical protein
MLFGISRCLVGSGMVGAALFVGGRALADDARVLPPPRGLELGVTLGIAHPGGAVGSGSAATTPNVSDVVPTWLPIGLDGGYRLWPHAYLGAALEWGPAVAQGEGSCGACSGGYDFQGRVEVRFYALPGKTFDPWASFGLGWEVLHLALGQGSGAASATYDGPILGDLEIGVDVRSRAFAVGPYFGFAVAEFVRHSIDPAPTGETSSIDGRAAHEWFRLGLRGTYGPW